MGKSVGEHGRIALLALGVSVILGAPTSQRSHGQMSSIEAAGGVNFDGSTIVSNPTDFQPELIYKKFPTTEPTVPDVPWHLGFGALLDTAPPSITVTLHLDPAGQNADVQILDGSATFLIQGVLNNNYDPAERFELVYNGADDPFLGPIDFLLEPDGLPVIPVRVHLNVSEQPGFPMAVLSTFMGSTPLGDILGDAKLEIVVPGEQAGVDGVHAFDHAGTPVSGWPFRLDDPDITDQNFASPAIVDLDRDGKNEVVCVVSIRRDVTNKEAREGFEDTASLVVIEGSGDLRWRIDADFVPFAIPAIADLNGDGDLEIIIGGEDNLMRFSKDGVRFAGWQVDTLNDITVAVPVIADVDGVPGNGLEIVACMPVLGSPNSAHIYVWNQDGRLHTPAWPIDLERCHTPAVVDLDGDPTNGLELVMATEHDEPEVDPGTGFLNTFTVFAWHADGTEVNGWPHRFLRDPGVFTDDRVVAPPSVADVDGDGDMEVVVSTYGQGDQAHGNLFLFHHDGTLDPNWPQWAGRAQTPTTWGGTALGDLDNDGQLEIVTASILGVYVFRADGSSFEGFPRLTATDNFAQPMIADLDGDGRAEILELSLLGVLAAWKVLTPSPDLQPWPRYRQNPARTGAPDRVFVAPIPTVSQIGLAAMFCLLVCAGIHRIRRNTRQSNS